MTWARDLIQIPTLLLEVVSLLREQNSLHRELIVALTQRPPSTRTTTPSPLFVQTPLPRKYTADDVSVVTREMRVDQQFEEQEQAVAPWRAEPTTAPASAPPSSSDADAVPTRSPASSAPNPVNPSPTQP